MWKFSCFYGFNTLLFSYVRRKFKDQTRTFGFSYMSKSFRKTKFLDWPTVLQKNEKMFLFHRLQILKSIKFTLYLPICIYYIGNCDFYHYEEKTILNSWPPLLREKKNRFNSLQLDFATYIFLMHFCNLCNHF